MKLDMSSFCTCHDRVHKKTARFFSKDHLMNHKCLPGFWKAMIQSDLKSYPASIQKTVLLERRRGKMQLSYSGNKGHSENVAPSHLLTEGYHEGKRENVKSDGEKNLLDCLRSPPSLLEHVGTSIRQPPGKISKCEDILPKTHERYKRLIKSLFRYSGETARLCFPASALRMR